MISSLFRLDRPWGDSRRRPAPRRSPPRHPLCHACDNRPRRPPVAGRDHGRRLGTGRGEGRSDRGRAPGRASPLL